MHNDGIRHEVIHFIFDHITQNLDTMAYAAGWFKQYAPESVKQAS